MLGSSVEDSEIPGPKVGGSGVGVTVSGFPTSVVVGCSVSGSSIVVAPLMVALVCSAEEGWWVVIEG